MKLLSTRQVALAGWAALGVGCAGLAALAGFSGCTSPGGTIDGDAGGDGGTLIGNLDAQTLTATCTGATTSCLAGTVADETAEGFIIGKVDLFRTFPGADAGPLATATVARDGTFALSSLPAWGHYYLRATTILLSKNDLASVYGPFTVPTTEASSDDGGIQLYVEPVTLSLGENALNGNPLSVDSVSAYLFDVEGNPVTDAGMTLSDDASSWAVPYSSEYDRYTAQLPTGTASAPSYTVTVNAEAYGNEPVTLNLIANPPTYSANLASPANNASINVGAPINVTWTAVPGADFENTELFLETNGGYETVYTSPDPNAADVAAETIPGSAVSVAGTYLLTVNFTNANCPTSANGCVLAAVVAEATLTAK